MLQRIYERVTHILTRVHKLGEITTTISAQVNKLGSYVGDSLSKLVSGIQFLLESDRLLSARIQQIEEQLTVLPLILQRLDHILEILGHQFGVLTIQYFDANGNPIPKGELNMLQLTDIQSVSATVTEVDAKGNPVPLVDGATVAWSVSDPSVLSLSDPAANPVTIAAVGPLSAAGVQVAVTVTNPDGTTLNAQDTVTVVASAATGLGIQFGTPA